VNAEFNDSRILMPFQMKTEILGHQSIKAGAGFDRLFQLLGMDYGLTHHGEGARFQTVRRKSETFVTRGHHKKPTEARILNRGDHRPWIIQERFIDLSPGQKRRAMLLPKPGGQQ
jgi:hypothetical protein